VSARERHGLEIGKRDQRAALAEVLDDPLGIGLAQTALHVAVEAVADCLAGVLVGQLRRAGRRRVRDHAHVDRVAGVDLEALEVVRVVRVPLRRVNTNLGLCRRLPTSYQASKLGTPS
jgi:hypothetical protein